MPGETILVADGNRRFLEKTEEILRGAGYKPLLATDAASALEKLRSTDPALLLAGADLEPSGGAQLIRVAKTSHDAQLPCVLLFASDDAVDKSAAADCAAENWLVRPLKRTELLAVVRDMITIRR